MSVQASSDIANIPFILSGVSYVREAETILQDSGRSTDLAFGTVMAKSLAVAGSVTADAGNTGDGTVTNFALAGGPATITGDWNLEVVTAITNGGEFKLEDPNGNIVAQPLVIVTPGAGESTTHTVAGMTFTITDGATDFAAGDKFALTVTAVNKWLPLDVTAVDGLQYPLGIYVGRTIAAADIAAGDVEDAPILVGGGCTVDTEQIVIEQSATLDTVLESGRTIREDLAALGIFAESTVDIDEYENS